MPYKARNHEENRKVVCLTCMKKATRQISAYQADRISKIYQTIFDFSDGRVPQGLCEACRTTFKRKDEGKDAALPQLFDFKSIEIKPETRGQECTCFIYRIARLKNNEKSPLAEAEEKKEGNSQAVRCSTCLSPLGRGLPHKCTQSTFRENMRSLAAQDPQVAEHIASNVVSNKESSPHGTIRLSRETGGHPAPVTPGPSDKSQSFVPALKTNDLVNLQLNTGLSNLGMKKLVQTVNQVTNSKMVEPNFCVNFQALGRKLEDFFICSKISSTSPRGQQENCTVVHCKSMSDLLMQVLQSRNVPANHIVKIGVDGGKGILKICLGVSEVTPVDECSESPPQKRFLTQRIAKDTSVKRQIIAAVAEDLPENYLNVKQLWSLVNANSIKYFISTDMKLANILFGLQAHSSSHPCVWCDVDSKNLSNSGTLRSFGSLRACLKAFENSRSDLSKAKFFGNVIHDPIVQGSEETLIIDVLPPMELHLLLGIVNHLFKAMKEVWQNADRWPAFLHIQMSEYHGGQFEGNECRKLLNNVDTLQSLAENDAAFQVFGFIETFRKFNSVIKACFGTQLEEDYGQKIDQLQSS